MSRINEEFLSFAILALGIALCSAASVFASAVVQEPYADRAEIVLLQSVLRVVTAAFGQSNSDAFLLAPLWSTIGVRG